MSERTQDGTVFERYGPEDAPALVLIHGLGLCRDLWAQHIPALAERHHVLVYDLPGHGDSAPWPANASLRTFSDQLTSVMDALRVERAAIVGFSIGGMINRRFALDHGERVSSLVILNSPHDRGESAQEQVEERACRARLEGPSSTLDAALERWFTPDFRSARSDVMAQVRAWRNAIDAESYAQTAWVLANGVRELVAPDPPVAAPALVMTCENDRGSTPAMARAIAREIAGARTLVLPNLRHLGLMEDPGAFTDAIVEFLRETPA